jgi:diaminohydroxyphosphoribosylaminopyrimidine deaminase / 5-amino-6-(5-phosphoribosylamino)uracil reductase
MASPLEVAAMRRAIVISAHGLGGTSPNPAVGCVVLDSSGTVVGEGWHRRKGEPHAETQALDAAGSAASGGTAVVTLEPCNHVGRTPACRQALLDAGVRRVIIAVMDPTSREEGGAAVLAAAGVEVEVGILEDEALLVLGPWLSGFTTARPWTTWAYQVTSTGPEPLTGKEAEVLRGESDVVVSERGVEEAVPDRHGQGMLDLSLDVGKNPAQLAEALYRGGARSALLEGGADLAAPFVEAGVVDRVVVFHLDGGAYDWPLVPEGFKLSSVRRTSGFVRVEAVRNLAG